MNNTENDEVPMPQLLKDIPKTLEKVGSRVKLSTLSPYVYHVYIRVDPRQEWQLIGNYREKVQAMMHVHFLLKHGFEPLNEYF